MADSSSTAFTVKVENKSYVLDKITLGDWRMLKTEFGLDTSDIVLSFKNDRGEDVEIFNVGNPNVLVGLMVAALHHERPHAPVSVLIAEVEALELNGVEFPGVEADEPKADAAPLDEDDDSEETESPEKGGSSGKPPKKPGRQNSQKS